ncbi:unnamed protein product [Spirodela intermedia]|uniref:Uncharacterized protein n=1 Tax=Spirodela intermedia TaxID=51605 RepID=A0A7I8L9K6_SPIIN|nr:unnamed protein product [Spirodela intermedia]
MTKYNVVTKAKRAEIQERKRAIRGEPGTGKLKQKQDNYIPVSGKRKRKLVNKWRRDQKEALQKGLISMEDVEMAVAQGTSKNTSSKPQMKFPLRKGAKLRIKNSKSKGKRRKGHSKAAATETLAEAMQE